MDFEMKNMTKYEGETIRIKCEITGFPLPQYTWYRDDIPIRDLEDRRDPDRINAKPTHWGSRCVT
jgi:receptor tyrosine kinase-like orphan receptor 1